MVEARSARTGNVKNPVERTVPHLWEAGPDKVWHLLRRQCFRENARKMALEINWGENMARLNQSPMRCVIKMPATLEE